MHTSRINQALLQPSGNNIGQNIAETQCETIRVPKACICSACWIVRGIEWGGGHHQFNTPLYSHVKASTAFVPGFQNLSLHY